ALADVSECQFLFLQAEDGIRDWSVTGVQTCALPISGWCSIHAPSRGERTSAKARGSSTSPGGGPVTRRCSKPSGTRRGGKLTAEIGRASRRGRGRVQVPGEPREDRARRRQTADKGEW